MSGYSKQDFSGSFMASQENISKVMKEVEDLKRIVRTQANRSFFNTNTNVLNKQMKNEGSYILVDNKQAEEKKYSQIKA